MSNSRTSFTYIVLLAIISFQLVFAEIAPAAQQASSLFTDSSDTQAAEQSQTTSRKVPVVPPSSLKQPTLSQEQPDIAKLIEAKQKEKAAEGKELSGMKAERPDEKAKPERSEFEKYISGQNNAELSTDLRQFAYDLFDKGSTSFAPVEEVPVSPDYVVGPGDELKISVWGSVDGQWNVVVDRSGNINLPKLGAIGVSGLTFSELKNTINKEMSAYFVGYQMNINLGSLKTMRIYIVGNAKKPGAYTISSLSTLVNAVFEAAGPSKAGSMRDFQVKRNGKVIAHFDMYDFIMKGDKSHDIRLLPDDVIYIPSVKALVGIAGSVNVPAIYELKGEKTLSQIIEMAGGLTDVAFMGRVQIERIVDRRNQVAFEADLEEAQDKDIAIQSGDLLKIFQVVQDKRVVRLTGAVKRPGVFGFTNGMKVKDLIQMAGGIQYYTYTKDAELTRVAITDNGPKTTKIAINLEKAMSGDSDHNITLEADDYLMVKSIPEWHLYRSAEVVGEVKFPGAFKVKKGETLSSLIERAGGYTDEAYLKGAVFTRVRVKELQQKAINEMVSRLERELFAQGTNQISGSTTTDEVQANKAELEAKHQFVESLRKTEATGRMTIKLAALKFLKGSQYDIALETGDSLLVPSQNNVVNVAGSVMSPGSYVYADELGYKDYVALSGGITEYANNADTYVVKADGSARRLGHGFLSSNYSPSKWEVAAFGETNKEIEPGDTIIIPAELKKAPVMGAIKDITQILMQIAVTAGIALKLY